MTVQPEHPELKKLNGCGLVTWKRNFSKNYSREILNCLMLNFTLHFVKYVSSKIRNVDKMDLTRVLRNGAAKRIHKLVWINEPVLRSDVRASILLRSTDIRLYYD